MICILEPKTDQALTGNFLFNKNLAAASHGKIERIALDKEDWVELGPGDTLLFDSAWIYTASARALAKTPSGGFLVHSLPEQTQDWQKALSACSRLVATSEPITQRLQRELPDQIIMTCLPGIDTRMRALLPQRREHDRLRLVTVANIMPRKGLLEALPFLRALEEKGLSFHWYIIGTPTSDRDYNASKEVDDRYVDQLVAGVDEYGFGDDVSFVGALPLEQQLRIYLNMDVAFFPSQYENFGQVLLETAQLGLPILTTDVGIAGSLFARGEHGLIVPAPLSLDCVDEALEFLKSYQGLSHNVRVNRQHALLNRSWAAAADDLIRAMRTLN